MAKENELTDQERVKKGEILIRIIVEIAGSPKEYVEKAISMVVDKVEEEKYVTKLVSEEVFEAEKKEDSDKIFASMAELEMWVKNAESIIHISFDVMPSSVEILEPSSVAISRKNLTDFMTELLGRLHYADKLVKELRASKQILDKNSSTLLRNFIISLVRSKAKNAKEMSKDLGMPEDQVKKVLETLEKEKLIKAEKDKYIAVKTK